MFSCFDSAPTGWFPTWTVHRQLAHRNALLRRDGDAVYPQRDLRVVVDRSGLFEVGGGGEGKDDELRDGIRNTLGRD